MKVLYCYWGENSAYDTIINLGKVTDDSDYLLKETREYLDGSVEEELEEKITDDTDVVFSFDFFPVISRVCSRRGKVYLSWIYDWPHLTLFINGEIYNKCNRIYLFEREGITALNRLGVRNVRYMPLAVDTERLDSLLGIDIMHTVYDYDVSFVGSLYVNKEQALETDQIPDYFSGYMDAVIDAQQKIYGYNFVNNLVDETFARKYLHEAGKRIKGFIVPDSVILANMINKAVTGAERRNIISAISAKHKMDLFTSSINVSFENVNLHKPVRYIDEMPSVFRKSKINLNITLRSITTGVPLRVIDILGAGGFCLTNYQEGILEHFRDGRDLVMYTGTEDLMDKISYYLAHDEERRRIAENGHETVKRFRYADALKSMLYAEDIECEMDRALWTGFLKSYYLDYMHTVIKENRSKKYEYQDYCARCRTIRGYIRHEEDIDMSVYGSADTLLVKMAFQQIRKDEFCEMIQACRELFRRQGENAAPRCE